MAGIYLHIPFCKQKCSYCDFHFRTGFHPYRTKMIEAMKKELELRQTEFESEAIETIYFGGGTPSLLLKDELLLLLQTIRERFQVAGLAEITLEVNPDDVNDENLKAWRNLGINRLSIGLQSFDDRDLQWMNRAHRAADSFNAVKLAQDEGFDNISVDVIYGLPDVDENAWIKTLETVISLNVQHISAYCLTVENRTELAHLVKKGSLTPADQDMQGRQFELLQHQLLRAGFIQYEVSNFCKPGFISRHNSAYWKGVHYLGIGPSAHSFRKHIRSWNVANNTVYMQEMEKGIRAHESEILSPKEQFNELLLTGLRTSWGVSLPHLEALHSLDKHFHEQVSQLIDKKLAKLEAHHLILTSEGLLFADRIAQDLFCD